MSARESLFEALQWAHKHQFVTATGAPRDPAEGGRKAVRENADALRRLRDA